jgi:hypothetical protein
VKINLILNTNSFFRQGMDGPCSLLCITCSTKSHNRSVSISRQNRTIDWPFEVLYERLPAGCGAAYICKVNQSAKESGLRYGDQVFLLFFLLFCSNFSSCYYINV